MVLFHQAVAERLGLSQGDHKCLDIIASPPDGERITPGRLAELSGLTTGAITGVLDRLEAAGYVRREKDPDDRRQVFVAPVPAKMRELGKMFDPLSRAMAEVASHFSERELERVGEMVKKGLAVLESETARLREGEAHGGRGAGAMHAPRGRIVEASFEAKKGAWSFSIGGCDDPDLYRADAGESPWNVEREGGTVVVTPKKTGFLDMFRSGKHPSRIDLNRHVAWSLSFRRGCANIEVDARALVLRSFELTGGVSKMVLRLPQPQGVVGVRIKGGAHDLRIVRPRHSAARVIVHGGLSGFSIDSQKLGSVGGVARWESPDLEGARNRYEIDLSGGVAGLALETA